MLMLLGGIFFNAYGLGKGGVSNDVRLILYRFTEYQLTFSGLSAIPVNPQQKNPFWLYGIRNEIDTH